MDKGSMLAKAGSATRAGDYALVNIQGDLESESENYRARDSSYI